MMTPRNPLTRTLRALAFGALAALAGCDGATGPGDPELTTQDASAIAAFYSDVDYTSLGILNLVTPTGTRSFNLTAPCPAGGSVNVNGSSESSTNQETGVVSTRWTTTKTNSACAVSHTRGDKTLTTVVDGTITTEGASSFKLPEKRGGERTLLSWSSTTKGSTTTKVGDRSSTCVVDLKETYDPAAKTFTVVGSLCGREVNVTRGLNR